MAVHTKPATLLSTVILFSVPSEDLDMCWKGNDRILAEIWWLGGKVRNDRELPNF